MTFIFGFMIGFLFGSAIGAWASRKHAKDPLYFKTRYERVFNRKTTNDEGK